MLMLACALVIAYLRAFFLPRRKLALEAAALRQQLAVFKRKQPRPKLHRLDRLFWIALRRLWSGWAEALIIVKPETVVSWHRAGFRLFWRWRSRPGRPGRPKVIKEFRHLIRRMKTENPTLGAPRIHGELLQSGFQHFRADRFSIFAAVEASTGRGQSAAAPHSTSSLFRPLLIINVSRALLFLRHRARSAADPALQQGRGFNRTPGRTPRWVLGR